MGACDHSSCLTLYRNIAKMRDEEFDCTGKLLRYRHSGSCLWFPAPESPAQKQMVALADAMDASRQTPIPGTIRVTNDQGGVKADGGKVQPRLLMQSMPNAVKEICEVLTYGANKYTPDNWKKVEGDRYMDALYRHLLAFHAGEQVDSETKKHHLAHAACCILFLLEKQNA